MLVHQALFGVGLYSKKHLDFFLKKVLSALKELAVPVQDVVRKPEALCWEDFFVVLPVAEGGAALD